ncbi:MAG: ribose 5-phosphate isomerase A [Solirubrobacteraceae bacterium]
MEHGGEIDASRSAMSERSEIDAGKRSAAEAAALLVHDGMRVGLGTGSTVAFLLAALAQRGLRGLRCVATSPATKARAEQLSLPVSSLERLDGTLDVAIDGADEVDEGGWLTKGGGGAHTREKVVAFAAERFVVIVSREKLVQRLGPPVALEILSFGSSATLRAVRALGEVGLRDAPPSPDGNLLADYFGPLGDPAELATELERIPGIVEHGLFPPSCVSEVLVGVPGGQARRLDGRKPPRSTY